MLTISEKVKGKAKKLILQVHDNSLLRNINSAYLMSLSWRSFGLNCADFICVLAVATSRMLVYYDGLSTEHQ